MVALLVISRVIIHKFIEDGNKSILTCIIDKIVPSKIVYKHELFQLKDALKLSAFINRYLRSVYLLRCVSYIFHSSRAAV